MKKRPPPPSHIPALSDAAMERIERGVFAALDARAIRPDSAPSSRRRVLAFAFAGATLTGAVFGVREWRRVEAPPTRTAEVATQVATEVRTEVTTTTSGSHVALAGAALDVAPQSAVSVGGEKNGAVVVVLERGAVTCEVAPRSKRAPFVVEAGQTRVTVIGTRFTVRRIGDHATVSVEHGLVEVADTNMTELVHAGERFRPGEPVTREPLASVDLAAAPRIAALAPEPSAPVETNAPQAAAKRAPVIAPPARTPHRRHVALATEETHAAPVVDAPAHEGPAAAPSASSEATPGATDSAVAAAEGPARAADVEGSTPRRSVQVLFELAAQLELRDPAAALRIYGELSNGEDGWAASALFASARLEAERGQAARARALAEAYVRRFPRGPNADDARGLLPPSR